MLKIQRTTDHAAIVLTVSGRLDAANVGQLCQLIDAEPTGGVVVLDLTDLILADCDVVRLLREFEARDGIVLRNCPAYIRIWMSADENH